MSGALRESRWEANFARMRQAALALSTQDLARIGLTRRATHAFLRSLPHNSSDIRHLTLA